MKRLLIAMTLLGLATQADAQFYVRGGVGYAFPQAGQTLDVLMGYPYSGSANNTRFEMDKVSFTSGFQGTIGVGYFLNKNVGIELNALIGIAPKKYEFTSTDADISTGFYENRTHTTYAKTPIILNPSLVLTTAAPTLNVYMRGGLAIAVKNDIYGEYNVSSNYAGTPMTAVYDIEYRNNTGLGFSGAAGLSYNVAPKMKLWLEGSMLSMSVYTKEAEYVKYTVDGINALPFFTADERTLVFEKEGNSTPTNNVYPSTALPFSNFGINFGVSVSFN